tara:strand:+ start:20 stop:184 length:165 start_codon:yes stop_codon:yes gene_type:complete
MNYTRKFYIKVVLRNLNNLLIIILMKAVRWDISTHGTLARLPVKRPVFPTQEIF